jgi:hypothetical protein
MAGNYVSDRRNDGHIISVELYVDQHEDTAFLEDI